MAEFEVGAALRLSSRAAQARVDGCLAIAERPAVLEALRSGRLDWVRAEAVASAVGELASRPGMAGAADAVEAQALGRAPGQTAPQVRAALARLVLKADPAGADARQAAARRERRVWVGPLEDGMAELRALLTAPDALRVYAALGAGWAARCADATPPDAQHGPRRPGSRPWRPVRCRPWTSAAPTRMCRFPGCRADGGWVPPGLGGFRPGGARPRPHRRPARPRGQRPRSWSPPPPAPPASAGSPPPAGYGPIPTPGPRARPGRHGGGC